MTTQTSILIRMSRVPLWSERDADGICHGKEIRLPYDTPAVIIDGTLSRPCAKASLPNGSVAYGWLMPGDFKVVRRALAASEVR